MIIPFEELRQVKDKLPSGSMQRIADELGLDAQTVRNYFGGADYGSGSIPGVHFEKGVNGGFVKLDDTRIYECALRMLQNKN